MSATPGLCRLTSSQHLGLDRCSPLTTSRASVARIPTAPSTARGTPVTSRPAPATASRTTSGCSTARHASIDSPSARERPCSTAISPKKRHSTCSGTSTRAAAFAPPDAWSASIPTPSDGWPASPVNMPTTLTTSSWLFPPRTREVQFDEKWSFVNKKQKNCDPTDPADDHKGDWWDHVGFDPEHKPVLAEVPGARSIENAEEVVAAAEGRTDDAAPRLMTSDEYPAYASAIEAAFGVPVTQPVSGPGRRPTLPERRLPEDLTYATVHKEREGGRVVAVERRL